MMRILMYSLQSSPMDQQSFRLWNLDLLMLDTSDREPTNFASTVKLIFFALAHVSNGDAVIGSKEKGTDTIEGLKGKTIAYSSGTSSEDILTKTLEKGGMTMDDITAMDMDATNIVTAMLSGSVDACATWVPNSLKVLRNLEMMVYSWQITKHLLIKLYLLQVGLQCRNMLKKIMTYL